MTSESGFAFLPLGAIIQRFDVEGTNIVQGFPSSDLYVQHNSPFYGETIGRFANRLSGAVLKNVNGQAAYPLAANNGPNSLHGGNVGWGKKTWTGPEPVGVRTQFPGLADLTSGGETVRFSLVSPDGDEGYPGTVRASVTYTAGQQDNVVVLVMDYEAELVDGAEETVINMTNHSYFNLSDSSTIAGTNMTLATNSYLPVDSTGIPTSTVSEMPLVPPGNTSFYLGDESPDIDDCFLVNTDPSSVPLDTRSEPLVRLASANNPQSRITLEVHSTEPAFQFYTGRFIDVPAIETASGTLPARGPRSAFCIEPSRYVNAANVDQWRNMVLLKKGQKYGARIVYRAWKDAL